MTKYYHESLACFLCRGKVFAALLVGDGSTYYYECEQCGLAQAALVYENSPWFEDSLTVEFSMTELAMLMTMALKEMNEQEYGGIVWSFWNDLVKKISKMLNGGAID